MSENDVPKKLLWVDLEMTGLEPSTQRIIEIAALVTDFELNEVARFESLIHQPDEVLEAAEEWPKTNMTELFSAVRAAEKPEAMVAAEFAEFITDNFGDERAVLAGNSIHQDRRFIRRWWPDVDGLLHYRMFDVSTLKLWVQGALGQKYEKNENHRALGDIEESILELKWCLDKIRNT